MNDMIRIMIIDLRVLAGNSFEDLTIFNVYAPSTHGNDIKTVKNFWTELENEVVSIPKSSTPIIGGTTNASIGNRFSHPEWDEQYFGPWGNNCLNDAGSKVVPLMQWCAVIWIVSTFYQHANYWTFKGNLQNKMNTLDYFLMHIKLSENVLDAKQIVRTPPSNHDPIILYLQSSQKKRDI
jgi:hypothetical protein